MVGGIEYEINPAVLRVAELLMDERLSLHIMVHGCESDDEAQQLSDDIFDLAPRVGVNKRGQDKRRNKRNGSLSATTKLDITNGSSFQVTFFGPRPEEIVVVKGGMK